MRHEVALMNCFYKKKFVEETSCSVSCFLPGHAIAVMRWCELQGQCTRGNAENVVRQTRSCKHKSGKGLGMNGMVNICESLISAANVNEPNVLIGSDQKVRRTRMRVAPSLFTDNSSAGA